MTQSQADKHVQNTRDISPPDRTEAAEYYFTYIDQVAGGDICEILRVQQQETIALLQSIKDDQSLFRYAPDKWSIRQLVGHVKNDSIGIGTDWFAGIVPPGDSREVKLHVDGRIERGSAVVPES